MPTFVSHAVTGLCAGKTVFQRKMPVRFWVLTMALPALPDLDSFGLVLGIPYGHFFSPWGLKVILSELLWVWLPSITIVITATIVRGRER